MFITVDILQKRGACQEYLDFFQKHYPDGVEMLHMIEKGHLSYYALHWGYQNLDPNEEEVAAYLSKICVVESTGVFESDHIYTSDIVSKSSQVTNSESVYHSKSVDNSEYVSDSECVDNSEFIGISSYIDNSERVLKGKNVVNSNEVYDCEYVMNSHAIYESNNIVSGYYARNCNNLTGCSFCADCTNLTNAMFCQGVSDGEYLLFNKPVDRVRFEMIRKQFEKYKPSLTIMEEWEDNFGQLPIAKRNYREHFKTVESSFWNWVKTLPGYDAHTIYSITFDPQFLN